MHGHLAPPAVLAAVAGGCGLVLAQALPRRRRRRPATQSRAASLTNAHAGALAAAVPLTREELGRSTWTLLHALAAAFPEAPSRQQQRDARELVRFLWRLAAAVPDAGAGPRPLPPLPLPGVC